MHIYIYLLCVCKWSSTRTNHLWDHLGFADRPPPSAALGARNDLRATHLWDEPGAGGWFPSVRWDVWPKNIEKKRWGPRTRMLTRMITAPESKYERRERECKVWSGKCGVLSVECKVWSVECKVWSVECSVEFQVLSVKCGVYSAGCKV